MKHLRTLEKLETRETPAMLTGSDLPPAELPQSIELPPAELPQPIDLPPVDLPQPISPVIYNDPIYVIGAPAGSRGRVRTINGDQSAHQDFIAFDGQFSGEVRAVLGDVNGDGVKDIIVGAGAGGGPRVQVWDGNTTQDYFSGNPVLAVMPRIHHDFFAFDTSFSGGVSLASADVDADGFDDIIVGAGSGGGPHVKVFSGKTGQLVREFFAFDPNYSAGVNLSAGQFNQDGNADIVVGSNGGMKSTVSVFNGADARLISSINPYVGFNGAVNVAVVHNTNPAANFVAGYFPLIVTAPGVGGGPHVKVFQGLGGVTDPLASSVSNNSVNPTLVSPQIMNEPVAQFMAYDPSFSGGVSLASADVNFDGIDEIITGAGLGGAPHIREFNAQTGTLLGQRLALRVNLSDPWYNAGVKLGS